MLPAEPVIDKRVQDFLIFPSQVFQMYQTMLT